MRFYDSIKIYKIDCELERPYLELQQSVYELKMIIAKTFKIDIIANDLVKLIEKVMW